jgi:hypothetical protein
VDRQPFLTTHRAIAVCAREFTRLTEEVEQSLAALVAAGMEETPVVRLSPTRCIVQLGPVALTIAWLRSRLDAVAEGELLVIVWQGAVARHRDHHPERPLDVSRTVPASVLWEDVLVAAAASETSWTWRPVSTDDAAYTSPELAARCVTRLRLAHGQSSDVG